MLPTSLFWLIKAYNGEEKDKIKLTEYRTGKTLLVIGPVKLLKQKRRTRYRTGNTLRQTKLTCCMADKTLLAIGLIKRYSL